MSKLIKLVSALMVQNKNDKRDKILFFNPKKYEQAMTIMSLAIDYFENDHPEYYDISIYNYENEEYNHEEYTGEIVRMQIKTDELLCFDLSFFDEYIYINTLDKCGISGTESLEKIEKLAEMLNAKFDEMLPKMSRIEYIELLDSSHIKICDSELQLSILKLLTTGQTWYNSKGYFSKQQDKIDNAEIIEMKYTKFIDVVFQKYIEKYKTNLTTTKIQEIKELFPSCDNETTVQQYFNCALTEISNCDCDEYKLKIKLLASYLDIIDNSNILKKTRRVEKQVPRFSPKGGKPNKKRKTRAKSSRHRQFRKTHKKNKRLFERI